MRFSVLTSTYSRGIIPIGRQTHYTDQRRTEGTKVDRPNGNGNGRAVRMQDIADKLGVHRTTVSLALRHSKKIGKETIDLVFETAREMGYDPMHNDAARLLAASRYGSQGLSNIIGLFFTHRGFSRTRYFGQLFSGILEAMDDANVELLTSDTYRTRQAGELPAPYRKGQIDGILAVTEGQPWTNLHDLLTAEPAFTGRAMVGLVTHIEGASAVFADNWGAGRSVAQHLLGLGHRHVLHFHGETQEGTDTQPLRLRAIRDAYRDAGLNPNRYLLGMIWNGDFVEDSQVALVKLLRQRREITAVIAPNDQAALEMHKALTKARIKVPRDISLVSYDDTDELPDARGDNMLTTVRLPLAKIGREGTKLLLRRITGEEPEDRDIVFPTQLMVRGSTTEPNLARSLRSKNK